MQSAAPSERYKGLSKKAEGEAASEPACARLSGAPVAYMMSRFPKLTETFVLFEALEMERQGVPVEIYPLQRETCEVMHPEAQSLAARAHYTPFVSLPILAANLRQLARQPGRYVNTLATVIRANLGSAKFLMGGLIFF